MIMRRPRRLQCLSLVATVLAASIWPQQSQQPPVRPNVVVIVLDDLGIESLASYDYNPSGLSCDPSYAGGQPPFSKTPVLDSLAANGVTFRRAYSYPNCSATRAALLSGRHGFRTGIGDTAPAPRLALSERTIPEMLKQGILTGPSYKCGVFGKWHVFDASDYMNPIDQGFDYFVGPVTFENHFDWGLMESNAAGPTTPDLDGDGLSDPVPQTRFVGTVIRERAVDWMSQVTEPFFAYVCMRPPHGPWQVPELATLSLQSQIDVLNHGYVEGQELSDSIGVRRAREWLIESADFQVGQIVSSLGSRLPRTTFLVVGDNGTPPNLLDPPYEGGAAEQGGHGKGSVYEQGVRVPFIAHGFKVTGRGFHEGAVSVVDLWRTVGNLAGAAPGTGGEDSWSLASILKDPLAVPKFPGVTVPRTAVYAQRFPNGFYSDNNLPSNNRRFIANSQYKYVHQWYISGSMILQMEEGFDLLVDPTECNPLPITHVEIASLRSQMIAEYGQWFANP